jgi:hypothetical protein
MARASFVLRSESTDKGSYLAYPPASASAGLAERTDDDTYLKADDFQVVTAITTVVPGGNQWSAVGFFNVEPIEYDRMRISWGIPLATSVTAITQPVQALIVYSPQGEPATVNEGFALVETTSTDGEFYHDVTPGEWAYYTVFIKYQDNGGTLYYEPAAALSALAPKNYGSSDAMYSRIPAYYRLQDDYLNAGDGGPLYKYLSLIGWDVDRFKTLLDYMISCKDPQVANSQTLDLLASDLGVDLTSEELGAARLRALLNDIGYLRRSNGTATTLLSTVSALTGSIVTQSGTNIRIQPQRVNYVWNPTLTSVGTLGADGGLPDSSYSESIDGGVPNSASTPAAWGSNTPYGEPPNNRPVDGGSPSTSFVGSGVWFYTPVGVTEVLRTTSASVPVVAGDTLYFSCHSTGQDAINSFALEYLQGTNRVVIGNEVTTPQTSGTRKYWRLNVPSDFTATLPTVSSVTGATTTSVTITFSSPHGVSSGLVNNGLQVSFAGFSGGAASVGTNWATTVPVASVTSNTMTVTFPSGPGVPSTLGTVASTAILAAIKVVYTPPGTSTQDPKSVLGGSLLLEKNYIGSYFDGSTRRGGVVRQGGSIFDHRWLQPANPNNSFSIYTENYQKTRFVTTRLLQTMLPVTNVVPIGTTLFSNRTATYTGSSPRNLVWDYIPNYS